MTTEFKTIDRFPGYRFGSDGSVWTCKERGGQLRWRIGTTWKQMTLNYAHAKGYARVTINCDGILKMHFVHRLILEAFSGPCPQGFEACHCDGQVTNNAISNLRWDTRSSNALDRHLHGTSNRGRKQPRRKAGAL